MSFIPKTEKRPKAAKPATMVAGLNGRCMVAPRQGRSTRSARVVKIPSVVSNHRNVSDAQFYLAAMTHFFADVPNVGRGHEM
ncbi:MAG: hypothetical protein IPP19_03115 [Verrucomicrobia bacterium]|nr:hypothetical protein [Verrucomicrobiota bacterium]